MARFELGDRCIVTGDKADWRHHFSAGTEVILGEWDPTYKAWHCEPVELYIWTDWDDAHNPEMSGQMTEDAWWVREPDLEHVTDVTDQEVRQLFGIDPKPHCTTCNCYTTTKG